MTYSLYTESCFFFLILFFYFSFSFFFFFLLFLNPPPPSKRKKSTFVNTSALPNANSVLKIVVIDFVLFSNFLHRHIMLSGRDELLWKSSCLLAEDPRQDINSSLAQRRSRCVFCDDGVECGLNWWIALVKWQSSSDVEKFSNVTVPFEIQLNFLLYNFNKPKILIFYDVFTIIVWKPSKIVLVHLVSV